MLYDFNFRWVGGHKFMVTSCPLPPLEEHHMKLHSLSQRDLLFCSEHFSVAGLSLKLSDPSVFPPQKLKI